MLLEYSSKNKIVLLVIATVLIIGGGVYFWSQNKTIIEQPEPAQTDNELWQKVTTDNGISFKYPKEILAKYINEAEWPPQVQILNTPFVCVPSGVEVQSSEQTELRLVDDRSYCVTRQSEGAAGSTYTSYIYAFSKDNKTTNITFSLRFVQCQNYDEPKASECENERTAFDVDGIVDRIAQSIKVQSKELSIAEELKDCLPKSDIVSHEKCQELLSNIRNFDECVNAGFSIMKSNPPQCATPDGKTFTQETNSTWDMAKTAVANCEVTKAFQSHSRIVNLELKNGNKLIASEPVIDDVMKIVNEAEAKCGRIQIATE